jgi:ribose 5-phosphate isomerase B
MIYLGTDHRGFEQKEAIKKFLTEQGIAFEDLGNHQLDPNDDYTDFGLAVAKKVAENPDENRGILFCGSGIGMSIIANRIKTVRAGLCLSPWMAEHGRQNEDINVLVLAPNISDLETNKEIIKTFLNTEFLQKENYIRRKKELDEI